VPTTAIFDPTDPTSYTQATSMTIYDSLGAAHTATTYYSKTATSGVWDDRLYIDGNAVGPAQQLTFSNTGLLTSPTTGKLAFPAYTPSTGAAPMTLTLDYGKATQYGNTFGVNSITQDGFTTGRLTGMNIDKTGVVQAQYTNGRAIPLGQIALSNFANPNGLQQVADTNWSETADSGQVLHGQAGTSGFGLVQAGALEASNVDITAQLVSMITAQRNFQANAQMISTADQITQTIINMR
jgi:flagellar hook protein FlgE